MYLQINSHIHSIVNKEHYDSHRQRYIEAQPKVESDSLSLHNSDNPGMVLVSAPLTDINYLAWSRSITLASKAKVKLGFIYGNI